MRHISFALVLSFFGMGATALELEESRVYQVTGERTVLRILSTADIEVFEPILLAFQQRHNDISIEYHVASSTDLMRALYEDGAKYDVAISSAMDLQTKLANDSFALKRCR